MLMKHVIRNTALMLALAGLLGLVAGPHFVAAQQKDKDKAAQKDKDKDKDKTKGAPAATFELYKDSGDSFRFRLKDEDGTILAIASKGYKTKADCQQVIDAIKRDAAKAKVDDQAK